MLDIPCDDALSFFFLPILESSGSAGADIAEILSGGSPGR